MTNFHRLNILRFCFGFVGFLFIIAILFPVFARMGEHGPRTSCKSNLKQIGLGLTQYTQDYNDTLPPIQSEPSVQWFGWAELVTPYVVRPSEAMPPKIFQCPYEGTNPQNASPQTRGYIDYWANSNLSSMSFKQVTDSASIVLAGEGNDGSDQCDSHYNLSALPPQWMTDTRSPLNRHTDGANYLFLDGHVKAYPAAQSGSLRFGLK